MKRVWTKSQIDLGWGGIEIRIKKRIECTIFYHQRKGFWLSYFPREESCRRPVGSNQAAVRHSWRLKYMSTIITQMHTPEGFFFVFHTFLKAYFLPSLLWPLLTLLLQRKENCQIWNDCLLVPVAMSPRLPRNRSMLYSLQWSSNLHGGSPSAKDKKLDLSGKLNVPSISTILLIFHQSCGCSSELWSRFSPNRWVGGGGWGVGAFNGWPWELHWKFIMPLTHGYNWVIW